MAAPTGLIGRANPDCRTQPLACIADFFITSFPFAPVPVGWYGPGRR